MVAGVSEGDGTNIVQYKYQHCSVKVPTLFSAKGRHIVRPFKVTVK